MREVSVVPTARKMWKALVRTSWENHHSVFSRLYDLPVTQQTVSKHRRQSQHRRTLPLTDIYATSRDIRINTYKDSNLPLSFSSIFLPLPSSYLTVALPSETCIPVSTLLVVASSQITKYVKKMSDGRKYLSFSAVRKTRMLWTTDNTTWTDCHWQQQFKTPATGDSGDGESTMQLTVDPRKTRSYDKTKLWLEALWSSGRTSNLLKTLAVVIWPKPGTDDLHTSNLKKAQRLYAGSGHLTGPRCTWFAQV